MNIVEIPRLPANFEVEDSVLDQLSSRPGHQRCVEGSGELLLILHEVPRPRIPEREALFFWKRRDNMWMQDGGSGISGLGELLDRYAEAIDKHEEIVDEADTAAEIFAILRHSGPLLRSSRNLCGALSQVLAIDPDDRAIRDYLDRARDIERAADLLSHDGRMALEFWRAERAEENALSGARLNRILYRLNLITGFFLPMVALGGLFGMNVNLPDFTKGLFWGIVFFALLVGGVILWLVARKTGRSSDFESEFGDD
ncbi:MAG: CorA family divalent cation transporter [Verrucomicrobiota bacterium]